MARGVPGKQATKLSAQAYVQDAYRKIVGYRNCRAQAVVLRLVRDAVPNHRTGVGDGVCLGQACRMWWWVVRGMIAYSVRYSIIKQRDVL